MARRRASRLKPYDGIERETKTQEKNKSTGHGFVERTVVSLQPFRYHPTNPHARFTTNALQYSNVDLTWDDDDEKRYKLTHRKFKRDDLKRMDLEVGKRGSVV